MRLALASIRHRLHWPEPRLAMPEAGWPRLRMLLAVSAGTGVLAALALFLWVRYGAAAYYEQMAAGLGICF